MSEIVEFRGRILDYQHFGKGVFLRIPKLVADSVSLEHGEIVKAKLIRIEKKDDPAPKSEQPPVASTPL